MTARPTPTTRRRPARASRGAAIHPEPDLEDFTAFYQREAARLVHVVSVVTNEPMLAEDAVAEAFARAWLRWPQLRGSARSPAPWVIQVALNECRGRFRRRQVERRKRHLVARPDVSHDPEPARREIWDTVAELPERERLLIALRYVADLSQDEIARTLNIANGTVASGLARARRRLGIELRHHYEEVCDGRQ